MIANVQVGQVVLLKDESLSFKWPLAIIQKVYPDDEDRVRVVDVKVAKTSTVLKRSIAKLVLLPIDVTPEPLPGSVGGVC